MPTLNYSTSIPVERTVGECQAILARAPGVSGVMVRYEEGVPSGLAFSLNTPNGERGFTMPVNIDGVQTLLTKQSKVRGFQSHMKGGTQYFTSREHAAKVAWRVVKDWLEAQLAIIDAQMASIDQVMLPYLVTDGGRTLYERFRDNDIRALEGGSRDA